MGAYASFVENARVRVDGTVAQSHPLWIQSSSDHIGTSLIAYRSNYDSFSENARPRGYARIYLSYALAISRCEDVLGRRP